MAGAILGLDFWETNDELSISVGDDIDFGFSPPGFLRAYHNHQIYQNTVEWSCKDIDEVHVTKES